jgi:DNA-binding MarR family transcriptional regulator
MREERITILRKLEEQLCFAIYSAGHAFNRAYKPLLDRLDVTYPQYLVLLVLWGEDDQTVSNIGQRLYLESSTLTPLLKRLESRGLLQRSRDPSDERQVRVRLTPAGRKLAHGARDVEKCITAATGTPLDELLTLKRAIEALRDRLLASDV